MLFIRTKNDINHFSLGRGRPPFSTFLSAEEWEWPFRGICVGEASHPGPLDGGMYSCGNEDDVDLIGAILLATEAVHFIESQSDGAVTEAETHVDMDATPLGMHVGA